MAIMGRQFGKAVCDHFDLPSSQVLNHIKANTEANEILSVTLTIALTPDDLARIAERMKAAYESQFEQQSPAKL